MKNRTRTVLSSLLSVLLVHAPVVRADDPPKTTAGTFELGGYGTSVDGSPDKAMEYEPTGTYMPYRLFASAHEAWGSIVFSSEKKAGDDESHRLAFDVQRTVRAKAWFDQLGHKQPHDPMTNLTAAVADGKYVWNTDNDPTASYKTTYLNWGARGELQLPSLAAATLGVTYNEQQRKGHVQLMALSHCESCHVTSQTRAIDEKTRDAGADLLVTFRGGNARLGYNHRELTNADPYALLQYDRALHPVTHLPIFDNRLTFDATEGPQKIDEQPDTRKNTGSLDFSLDNVGGFAVTGVGVLSKTENRYAGLEASYAGGMLALARNWDSGLRLRWRTRYYTLDNDDVAVDVNERRSVAGPQAGKTYREVYGYDPDFTRTSALNRDVYESNLETAFRLGKKAGTLRAVWNFRSVDRENVEAAPGEHTTTTNVLGLSWRAPVAKGLRLFADYRHGDVAHPLLALDATCSQLVYPKSGTSGLDTTLAQYYMSHAARTGDGTATPSAWDEVKAGLTWTSGAVGLTANYRYWSGDNSDGDFTDWSKKHQSATVTLWSMPSPTWDWYVAWAYTKSELGGHTCISLFDG
jgi:hypothetical protein